MNLQKPWGRIRARAPKAEPQPWHPDNDPDFVQIRGDGTMIVPVWGAFQRRVKRMRAGDERFR